MRLTFFLLSLFLLSLRLLTFQVRWDRRFIRSQRNICLITVDGTDFPIQEPWPFVKAYNKKYYSHKYDGAALRYEVGICIITGEIVWYHCPFPAGMSDLQIFRLKLAAALAPFECVVADKGYRGDHRIHTPFEAKDEWHLAAMAKARARHETINRRFKIYKALSSTFRHDRSKHHICFEAAVTTTQLEIQNNRPAFSITEYEDVLEELDNVV